MFWFIWIIGWAKIIDVNAIDFAFGNGGVVSVCDWHEYNPGNINESADRLYDPRGIQ